MRSDADLLAATRPHASPPSATRSGAPPAPEVADWKGTAEPTVDASKHVNGGCRTLRSDGLAWDCYLGREAVAQQIIGAGMLGIFAPSPGVG